MSEAETGLSSSTLSSLGGQQTDACSSQRLLFPQIIPYFIHAFNLPFCFPLQPCILHGKQLSMSTLSASITDYKLYWPGLTVPEKSQSLVHPYWQLGFLFLGCQRDSQMLCSDSKTILNQFCSALVSCGHQAHFLPSPFRSWKHVLLSAFFIAWKIQFWCLGHSFFM